MEIRHAPDACEAVRAIAGKRYLSAEAPLLPLKDCDRSACCKCRYHHRPDRRDGPRRASEGVIPTSAPQNETERRARKGRRSDDDFQWEEEPEEEPERSLDDTYYDYVNQSTRGG